MVHKNERDEKAFDIYTDDLTNRYNIYSLDTPFININRPEDIKKAEKRLAGTDKNG